MIALHYALIASVLSAVLAPLANPTSSRAETSAKLKPPALCSELAKGQDREPDETRSYVVLVNDTDVGTEVFQYWITNDHVQVNVTTTLEGSVFGIISIAQKHCRKESWKAKGGKPIDLIHSYSATNNANIFLQDTRISLYPRPDGAGYSYESEDGERTQVADTASTVSVTTPLLAMREGQLVDVFEYRIYDDVKVSKESSIIPGTEQFRLSGDLDRLLWFKEGHHTLLRLCGKERFGVVIETRHEDVLENDLAPCVSLFR